MTNITISLETAKKLKEAGRNKECDFYYQGLLLRRYDTGQTIPMYDDTFPAPTAQEILDEFERVKERVKIMRSYPDWRAHIIKDSRSDYDYSGRGDTVTEALADLWVECKEQGYLSTLPKE